MGFVKALPLGEGQGARCKRALPLGEWQGLRCKRPFPLGRGKPLEAFAFAPFAQEIV